jgi:DNA polymerase/3'-5' exonuclease PolX
MKSLALSVVFSLVCALFANRLALASHYAVTEIPRLITPTQAEKLQKAGVGTTEELLAKTGTAKDRKALAKASGLGNGELTDLVRHCDLLRIRGVGPEMVLLFEAAGVKGIADLSQRDAAALTDAVATANKSKKISEKLPTQPQLQTWIDEAKKLPAAPAAK